MKVLITGGRDFTNQTVVNSVLEEIHRQTQITSIIEGGANGADLCGRRWAVSSGIPCNTFHAEWARFGKSAGYKRNVILAEQKPDLTIAFPGGKGTEMMCQLIIKAGLPLKRVLVSPMPLAKDVWWWSE